MKTTDGHDIVHETEQLFRAIGHVVVSFQLLELWLAEALCRALSMSTKEDSQLILAAMSYKQKVDLLFELYVRHGSPNPKASAELIRTSLTKAEEARNRIVHSVWAVNGDAARSWVRTKGSLRSKSGFNLVSNPVEVLLLEETAVAMREIRGWEYCDEAILQKANQVLARQECGST